MHDGDLDAKKAELLSQGNEQNITTFTRALISYLALSSISRNGTGIKVVKRILIILSQIKLEVLNTEEIIILSGPSHAEEVSQKFPTTVVAACVDINHAREVQKLFSNDYYLQ